MPDAQFDDNLGRGEKGLLLEWKGGSVVLKDPERGREERPETPHI